LAFFCVAVAGLTQLGAQNNVDPLPSWNDGASKKAIVDFVTRTTATGGADFVPIDDRIATFDNDGTLWVEQPMYTQLAFALDRVEELASQHPEWKTQQPFKAVLDGDMKVLAASGEPGLLKIIAVTHAGMSTQQFAEIVTQWLATAQHPRFKRPYTECVYQPMLEVLNYLRANGFKTYIVSGGGVEFMRPWSDRVYGVPPEQVAGSSIKTKYEMQDGEPVLMRLAEIQFIDDKAGKPEGINQYIGKRPIAAFGNSDGDQQMLEWTAADKEGKPLMLLVHHTDAEREYKYDRQATFGKLDTALNEAKAKGWTVVDMKTDWKVIFPADKSSSAQSPSFPNK
jgi:phosphoserine phosphatase